MMTKLQSTKWLVLMASVIATVDLSHAACNGNQALQPSTTFPSLSGRLVYHAYFNYGDGSSALYLHDFVAHTTVMLNKPSWNLSDPMNAQFSADGKKLLFMAIQNNAWNVFVWTIGSDNPPLNLTASLGGRNEDPKFTFDGKRVAFKHEGDVGFLTLAFNGAEITGVDNYQPATSNGWITEESMPTPSPSGKYLLYTIGAAASRIYRMNMQTGQSQLLTSTPAGAHDYFPVMRDMSTYFFTRGMPVTGNDQVMMMVPNLTGSVAKVLALNDCNSNNSDATPVDEDNLIFSSSRYDPPYGFLIGEIGSGKVWRLSSALINLNDGKQKLGANYSASR